MTTALKRDSVARFTRFSSRAAPHCRRRMSQRKPRTVAAGRRPRLLPEPGVSSRSTYAAGANMKTYHGALAASAMLLSVALAPTVGAQQRQSRPLTGFDAIEVGGGV